MDFLGMARSMFSVAEEYSDLEHDPHGDDVVNFNRVYEIISRVIHETLKPKIFIEIDDVYFELSPHRTPYKNIHAIIPKYILPGIIDVENTIQQINTIISDGCTPDDFMDDDISKVKDLLNLRGDLELQIPLTLCNIHVEKQQTLREKVSLLMLSRDSPGGTQLKNFLDDQEKKNMTLYDKLIRDA